MRATTVRAALPEDAGEVLTLQRAAYVTEAQLYADPGLPPLVQPLESVRTDLAAGPALVAVAGHRIVGTVRGRVDPAAAGTVLRIGRLAVAPDLQGLGIGTRLLAELELLAPPEVSTFALFAGHLSEGNLRLYRRLGYHEVGREAMTPTATLVHLEKVRAGAADVTGAS
jgi:ribosomal protein S18 acetylase RimI-like enzyme